MLERGVNVDHKTIYRWVQPYSPELDKRCRPYLVRLSRRVTSTARLQNRA